MKAVLCGGNLSQLKFRAGLKEKEDPGMKDKDNKTVAITMRFFTDNLKVELKGKQTTSCWDSGFMKIEQNKTKGIGPMKPLPFNCYEDIIPLMKEIFRKNRILVVSKNRKPRVLSAARRIK